MRRFLTLLLACLSLTIASGSTAQADTNNFQIVEYKIDYQLSRDNSNRSVLKTTETIVADFPPRQNRGIERSIPTSYDGHKTSLSLDSVTNQQGESLEYTTYSSSGNKVVRIGNPDRYVEGRQVYKLAYSQRDVTRAFTDTEAEEFYWDTNGTDWQVPISSLSVSLTIQGELSGALNGQTSCYVGQEGSGDACQLSQSGTSFAASATGLAPGENITLAIGFEPGTFAGYEMTLFERLLIGWVVLQVVLFAAGLGLLVWLGVRYASWSKRKSELNPIPPEYLPPKDSSVEVSARLIGSYNSFPALLIDMAVRRYINIHEVKPSRGWKPGEYELEIIKPLDGLRTEEREVLTDIFQGNIAVGSRLNLKKLQNNTKIYTSLQDNPAKLKKLIREDYGLRARDHARSAKFKRTSLTLLIVGILFFSPVLLLVSLVAYIMSRTLHPLTDKGLDLLRYLEGLKMYIKVAETERLKMLQSPEGALKVGDASDPRRLVKLYEKVLPYAVLFGLEKDWNKQLGHYYQATARQPDWFISDTGSAFTAGAFAGAMSSFKTTSTYSSHSSSSSGGSSGGGFSGGGGGGGGGAGW